MMENNIIRALIKCQLPYEEGRFQYSGCNCFKELIKEYKIYLQDEYESGYQITEMLCNIPKVINKEYKVTIRQFRNRHIVHGDTGSFNILPTHLFILTCPDIITSWLFNIFSIRTNKVLIYLNEHSSIVNFELLNIVQELF